MIGTIASCGRDCGSTQLEKGGVNGLWLLIVEERRVSGFSLRCDRPGLGRDLARGDDMCDGFGEELFFFLQYQGQDTKRGSSLGITYRAE